MGLIFIVFIGVLRLTFFDSCAPHIQAQFLSSPHVRTAQRYAEFSSYSQDSGQPNKLSQLKIDSDFLHNTIHGYFEIAWQMPVTKLDFALKIFFAD